MVDQVVPRGDMRGTLARLLRVLTKNGAVVAKTNAPAQLTPPEPAKKAVKKEAPPAPLDKAAE